MSTESTPNPEAPAAGSSTPATNQTPSQPSGQNPPSDGGTPANPPADAAKSGDSAKPGAEAKKPGSDDLLFGQKPKEGEGKGDQPKPPTADEIKAFLKTKGVDDKALEGKTDDDIKKMFDDAKAKDAKDAEAAQAANTLKFDDLKIPTDYTVTDEVKVKVDELSKVFNDSKLTANQKMQKAIDLHVEQQQKVLDNWNDTKAAWRNQVKNDKELGGENLTQSVNRAESMVARFGGTPDQIREMQDDLILLGLGNKRSFIRFCNNIFKATAEDSMGGGGGGTPPSQQKTLAERMWPDMPKG